MPLDLCDRALWARILAVDETSHEYFAQREDIPGAILFTNSQSPDSSLALIQQSAAVNPGRVLESVIDHYARLGLDTRVRLTPLSAPGDWPQRLAQRGFHPLEQEDKLFMALTPAGAGGGAGGTPAPDHGAAPPLAVRRVSPEAGADVGADIVTRVQRAGFGAPKDDLDDAVQATQRSLAAGHYRFYVAYLGSEPVGAASARMVRDSMGGVAGLYGLTTLSEARRQGIGSAMVKFLVNEAVADGHDLVFLSVDPGSGAARLYARLGFAPVFTVRNYLLRQPGRDGAATAPSA
jgi:ribosomal protein S18 acetylase RimI-like enzyme